MYLRAVHSEFNIPFLREFIRNNPLGILTTAIPSPTYSLIQASHIPWLLDVQDETSDTEPGSLRGHIARANPQCKAMIESVQDKASTIEGSLLEQEVYILFNGSADAYVTPKFYVDTKPTTGKVVPTWNYSAVQIYGKARIYFDPQSPTTKSFIHQQVSDLSDMSETHIMGYSNDRASGKQKPWKVDDAPESYVDLLQKAIIGIEVQITRLEGKFKMSQEMNAADRKGVAQGFAALGTTVGSEISNLVQQRGALKAV